MRKPPTAHPTTAPVSRGVSSKVLTNRQDERDKPGEPSPYACPDCGGVLWELNDGEMLRFRCRVGHASTADTLLGAEAHAVEQSLWSALRALEEQAAVKKRMAERLRRQGRTASADQIMGRARALELQGQQVRDLLLNGVGAVER